MNFCRTRPHFLIVALWLACVFPARAAASDTILFSFSGRSGAHPFGALVSDGRNLFGTTRDGGVFGAGTIFELIPTTSGGYSEIVLYSFRGGSDGGFPIAGVILDSNGALYGTTSCGGSSRCVSGKGGFGVVYKFSSAGYEPLHRFTGGADGENPVASLTFDRTMNLYGTTRAGGRGNCVGQVGCGVIFQLSAASRYLTEKVLYAFTGGTDGGGPQAPVIFNAAENTLYGTTYEGGIGNCAGPARGCGVAFQLSLSGTERVLHHFTGKGDGSLPVAPLVFDTTNTLLFGAASAGGNAVCLGGCGVVFQLSGTTLTTFRPLHFFGKSDGADPTGGVAFDTTDSSLYGTTFAGGASNLGVVYNLDLQTGGFSLIHSFSGSAHGDGANPYAGLLLGTEVPASNALPPPTKRGCPSKCAGTTVTGGAANFGTAYSD